MDLGHLAQTAIPKKGTVIRGQACKFNNLVRKPSKQPLLNSQQKPPKCYIKITGSRYNGTFLLNINNSLDDAIYNTMRDIEVALETQADQVGKPMVSPRNCLSSVFRCFGTSGLQTKAVRHKKKQQKLVNKPAECSLSATMNRSDLGPLISGGESSLATSSPSPGNSSESVMREVVDVFRSTLDQFRHLSSSEALPSKLLVDSICPEPSKKHVDTVNRSESSHPEVEKVSFIKFSEEEVLVIQPPKPSRTESKELEVGIEVKPKTTASNVVQSIKLFKDKVLIGIQDGKGVLQINDSVPKRSLQMVIEEGLNGKPSLKLCVTENKLEKDEQLIPQQNDTNQTCHDNEPEHPQSSIDSNNYVGNGCLSTIMSADGDSLKNYVIHDNDKFYKSVESRVSRKQLQDVNVQTREREKCKSESVQDQNRPSSPPIQNASPSVLGMELHAAVENIENELAGASQDTVLNSPYFKSYTGICRPYDSRLNRIPFLVHTLYEPRSLPNSSAYFASDYPSSHRSVSNASNSKNSGTSQRQVKNLESFSLSSDHSSSTKCIKIFRDIGEIRAGCTGNQVSPLHKKDASMTASMIEDFEAILQNMCGSSYLRHDPEQPDSEPNSRINLHKENVKPRYHIPSSLSFDRGTQTDSHDREVQTCTESPEKKHASKGKTSNTKESRDASHSRALSWKLAKKTRIRGSQESGDSVLCTSELDDITLRDSSGSEKHNLVFSTLRESDNNQLARTSNCVEGENWIPGPATSFVGQKIFAAIRNDNSQSEFLGGVKSNDSFAFPLCKYKSGKTLQEGSNNSVVNMALCDVNCPHLKEEDIKVISGESSTTAPCEIVVQQELEEQWNHKCKPRDPTNPTLCCPTVFKSKSCQNLSLAPNGLRSVGNLHNIALPMGTRIMKMRYPHLTATNSSISALNGLSITTNFNEGDLTVEHQPLANFDKTKLLLDQALPAAIQPLLLPKEQSIEFNKQYHIPTNRSNRLGTSSGNYWELGVFNQNEYDWWTPNEVVNPSVAHVLLHRSLFKRTFNGMRTVRAIVTRKLSSLYRKFDFTHSGRKKKNSAVTDSVAYLGIPLKKTRENLHLYPRAGNI